MQSQRDSDYNYDQYSVVSGQPFEIVFDARVAEHLRAIGPKWYSLIEDTIEQQLSFAPEVETRNRKPLTRPSVFGSAWELRFGPTNRFRVFYRFDSATQAVRVLAIGVKSGSQLYVGGEPVKP